ncbi:uncharacterized protein LOC143244504 isoform X2 [Tachypleus tridentatus]|uniref:uncharacterized protein LOC143244504 isoform X2 n=1 Tax=Tachypleus tridentatus TaxID=6853 RepID=UPI003FD064BC
MAVIYSILCFFRCPRCSSSCSCVLTYFECVRSVMHKHLEKMGDVTFDKIFNQKLVNIQRIENRNQMGCEIRFLLVSKRPQPPKNAVFVTSFSKNFAKASVMKNLYPSSSFTKSLLNGMSSGQNRAFSTPSAFRI